MRTEKATNLEDLKTTNKRVVLSVIRSHKGPISRSEISARTALSYPTVMRLLDSLIDEGLVKETGIGRSTGGRRPVLVEFRPGAGYVVGVNLDRNQITAAVGDLNAEFVINPRSFGPIGHISSLADQINSVVAALIEEMAGTNGGHLFGIGIGVRGALDRARGTLYHADTNQPVLLRTPIEDRFGVPVILDHNYNVALIAEKRYGKYSESDTMLYVNIGTGVSAGIMIDGRLHRGVFGNAGEFGHMSVSMDGAVCDKCGKRGCIESYASAPAIVAQALELIETDVSQESVLRRLASEHPESGLTLEMVVRAAEEEDELARQVMRKAADVLSYGLSDIINLLAPELIVIGGAAIQESRFLLDEIRSRLSAMNGLFPTSSVRVELASVTHENIVRGALLMALEETFDELYLMNGSIRQEHR